MFRRSPGPYRSASPRSYLRQSRVLAALSLLALAGGIVSDALAAQFWSRHPLLAGLSASLIVVMLTVALVNEVAERRQRRRWFVLAQYVMLELVGNARMIWTGVLEVAGLFAPENQARIDRAAEIVHDTPRLAAAVRDLLAEENRRRALQQGIGHLVSHSNEVLGRWAGVMLNADAYAEMIDRHVELADDVWWLGSVLENREPIDDDRARRWRIRGSTAMQVDGDIDDEQLANRIATITQLAESLDRSTLELALRIVPIEWWAERLEPTFPAAGEDADAGTDEAGAQLLARRR